MDGKSKKLCDPSKTRKRAKPSTLRAGQLDIHRLWGPEPNHDAKLLRDSLFHSSRPDPHFLVTVSHGKYLTVSLHRHSIFDTVTLC